MATFTKSLIPSRSMYPRHPVYAAERKLGVQLQNPYLLKTALTHSSYLNEHLEEQLECNERLEFLGDSILGFVVTDEICQNYPDLREGALTQIRANVVNTKTLARAARNMELGEQLLLGSGEENNGGANLDSNLANAYEAVVAAIFIDRGELFGIAAARDFILRTLKDEINTAYNEVTSAPKQVANTNIAQKPNQSKKPKTPVTAGKHPKSALQEISQAKHGKPPVYRITKATGKSNAMTFTAQVQVNGKALGTGSGSSKKAAETAAAQDALNALQKSN